MKQVGAWMHALDEPARTGQVFMLCRHAGVLLGSVIMARQLPVEGVGTMEMLFLTGYLFTFFWSDALLKAYLAGQKNQGAGMTSTTFLLFILVAGLFAMAILLLGQAFFIPVIAHRATLEGLALFALYQALLLPLWMVPFISVLRGLNIWLACGYVLIGPSFALWFGLNAIPDVQGALMGLVSYALVGLVWMMTQLKFGPLQNVFLWIKSTWPVVWPLALYAIVAMAARSFDAWLVARTYDDSVFAIFRYGAREFPFVVALAAGLSTSMIGKLVNEQTIGELRVRSTRLMHICYPVVGLLLLCSPVLFVQVYGEHYRASADIFSVYLILTLSQLVFPQSVLTARGDTRIMWIISMVELGINIAVSVLLLKWIGLAGVAWGTVIAFSFEKGLLFWVLYRKYQIRPQQLFNPKTLTAYSLLLLICYLVSAWMNGM